MTQSDRESDKDGAEVGLNRHSTAKKLGGDSFEEMLAYTRIKRPTVGRGFWSSLSNVEVVPLVNLVNWDPEGLPLLPPDYPDPCVYIAYIALPQPVAGG